jgi:hypothetical protein
MALRKEKEIEGLKASLEADKSTLTLLMSSITYV